MIDRLEEELQSVKADRDEMVSVFHKLYNRYISQLNVFLAGTAIPFTIG